MPDTKTILLVEDDEFLRRMYTRKLESAGFSVVTAADGEKALALIAGTCPDLVLLDIIMPKKDGFEVLKDLRAAHETKELPVILLTNLSEPETITRARALRANEYLIKSHFLPSEIVAVVQKYIAL